MPLNFHKMHANGDDFVVVDARNATHPITSALAKRMHTSRTVVDRMLDATDTGLTLETMTRAATALGFRVKVDLVAA